MAACRSDQGRFDLPAGSVESTDDRDVSAGEMVGAGKRGNAGEAVRGPQERRK